MSDFNLKPSHRKPNIMITYDDPAVVGVVSSFLTNEGFNVSHCTTFDEFTTDEHHDLDYLLIDITHAEFSTFHELGLLRKVLPGIKVIATIDQFDTDRIMNALDAGVNDYLVKPFSIRELVDRLRVL